MRALRQRMHAGVRSPCAVHAHFRSRDTCEGIFEMILDRVAVRLTLPAGERTTVIRDDELKPARHSLARNLRAIEVALQNHLRRDLIDHAARMFCFLPRLPQGTMRRSCR